MNFKKWIQLVLLSTTFLILAACSTGKKANNTAAINDANAAYNAQASGLGDESRFGDEGTDGQHGLAKRTYYFDYDSNVVRDEDKPAIYANADYLAGHADIKIILEGHTDPRGSREYNIGLGERRARAVADVLISKGVQPGQIRIVSYGAQKLATAGHSEEDYQLDRRVIIVHLQR